MPASKLKALIQQTLAIIADIEARYTEELYRLAHSGLPEAVKDHLLRDLSQKRATAREPHLLGLADLRRELSMAQTSKPLTGLALGPLGIGPHARC